MAVFTQHKPQSPLQPESLPKFVRVAGLDSIRFIAALFVAIDHLRPIPIIPVTQNSPFWERLLSAICGGHLFNAPPAVIIFFVISGFCIHYSYHCGRSLNVFEFYTRRLLRILIPVAAVLPLAWAANLPYHLFEGSILWSLFAELVYYGLYPLFFLLRKHLSWKPMIIGAFVVATGVAWTDPGAQNYPSFGMELNWLLGLPCWLLGCQLAEAIARQKVPQRAPWNWRLGIWALAIGLMLVRFHSEIGYPHTLNYFGFFVYLWLLRDLPYLTQKAPPRWLESAGRWSYSLYLLHFPIGWLLQKWVFTGTEDILSKVITYFIVFASAYIFYRLVEYPAHRLAKHMGTFFSIRAQSS